jgi:hypothetical protein
MFAAGSYAAALVLGVQMRWHEPIEEADFGNDQITPNRPIRGSIWSPLCDHVEFEGSFVQPLSAEQIPFPGEVR